MKHLLHQPRLFASLWIILCGLCASHPASAAVIAHYSFDADFQDSSGNGWHGTLTDVGTTGNSGITTHDGERVFGAAALHLSADRDYVSVPTRTFGSGTPYSIAFWARKSSNTAPWSMVIGQRDNSAFFIALNNASSGLTGLRWRSANGDTNRQADFTAPNDTNWHHHVITADPSQTIRYYLDGALVGTATGKLTGFTYDTIGEAYTAGGLDFNGEIDEMWIFDVTIPASIVSKLYLTNDPTSPVERVRVFLQGGQSNADGRATNSELPTSPVNLQQPQTDIDYFYRNVNMSSGVLTTLRPGSSASGGFGPEITFGLRIADRLGSDATNRVAIIKYAVGGTGLTTHWTPGGDASTTGDGGTYVAFQQTVTAGLSALTALYPNASIAIEGMIWMQGENDTGTIAPAYHDNLVNFIADVRATYGANLPFVIGRLSSLQIGYPSNGLAIVRQAQTAVADADPWTRLVDTDLCSVAADNGHFNAAGQQLLGYGFAGEMDYQLWAMNHFSAPEINAGKGETEVDPDGDGQRNYAEMLAGTNPANSQSAFRMTGIARQDTTGQFQVSWRSVPGHTYFVLATDNLATGTWTNLATIPAAAAPAEATEYVDPRAPLPARQFYKIQVATP